MGRMVLGAGGLLLVLTAVAARMERFEASAPPIADGGAIDEAHGWVITQRGGRVTTLPDGIRMELVGPDCAVERGCHVAIARSGAAGPAGLGRTTAVATWAQVHRGVPQTFGLHGSVRERLHNGHGGAGWPIRDERLVGDGGPEAIDGASRLRADVHSWEVWWRLSGVSGVVELRDVRGGAVQTRPVWRVVVALVGITWLGWTATAAASVARLSARPWLVWLGGVVAVGVLVGTLAPDAVLDPLRIALQGGIDAAVSALSTGPAVHELGAPTPPAPPGPVLSAPPAVPVSPPVTNYQRVSALFRSVDKLGHLASFASLAVAVLIGLPRARWPAVLAGVAILAGGTELLQRFTLDRTARWVDLGIDAAGVGLGLVVVLLFTRLARGRADAGPSPQE